VVDIPTRISKEAKELLRQYDQLTGDSLTAVERAGNNKPQPEQEEHKEKKKKRFWEK
jgi:molecular chaperone DnaJ